jgi:peptide/nickel transport system permease protein
MMPVVLWTDALVFLLVAVAIGFGVYASRHTHLRAPWREVARSRVGMAALVILGGYCLIGLLDTVHFRLPLSDAPAGTSHQYAPQVLSLFDVWAAPLRERQEKTYSAPFATRLFVKEAITLPDGRVVRDYPRLQYGGRHLPDPDRRGGDILACGGVGRLGSHRSVHCVVTGEAPWRFNVHCPGAGPFWPHRSAMANRVGHPGLDVGARRHRR